MVTFEQINKPRMPGWLSKLDGAANESAAAALSATMEGGATGTAATAAADGEMSSADFAARMEVDSDDEEAVSAAAAALSLTGSLSEMSPSGVTKLPPISPAARTPSKTSLAV